MKSEIRNPKSETMTKFEIRIFETSVLFRILNFGHLDFVSSFDIRISNLGFVTLLPYPDLNHPIPVNARDSRAIQKKIMRHFSLLLPARH